MKKYNTNETPIHRPSGYLSVPEGAKYEIKKLGGSSGPPGYPDPIGWDLSILPNGQIEIKFIFPKEITR